MKSGKSGLQQQIDLLKAKIELEQNNVKSKRGKLNYRSADEIDREIKYALTNAPIPLILHTVSNVLSRTLESQVDSGKLKLVDEKKNLKKITDLRALKKQMSVFTVAEESIKADIIKRKALQEELTSSTSTPQAKALSEEYDKIKEEMNKIRGENDEAFAKRGELRAQRDEFQKDWDRAYKAKKGLQDEYYKQREAYRTWNEQNRKVDNLSYLTLTALTFVASK